MKNRICLAPKALSHVSLGHIALGIRLLGNPSAERRASIPFETHRLPKSSCVNDWTNLVEVNRAFSAGTFRVLRDLGRTPQAGNEFCVFGAKHRLKIPRVFLRTDLINRKWVCCWRFGVVARREEGEYPLWICDRRAMLLQWQGSVTLPD